MPAAERDWCKPAAIAIPREGYFELERGRYGPIYPRTPACYGFSILAKVKEGHDIVLVDSTNFTTLFGGTESLTNFWRNLATMK